MPRLPTNTSPRGYFNDIRILFTPGQGGPSSLSPSQTRKQLAKSILLRSVKVRIFRDEATQLPLRVRPAMIVLNALSLILLGLLGLHPRAQDYIPFINDKVLHFVCFFFATALFYVVWDVEESARRIWFWRHAALYFSFITCFAVGGIGSEVVQSLLPYKTFQFGDVIANLAGSALGLFFSYHAEARYRSRREIERLYQPLDVEDYGDFDLDDEEDEEAAFEVVDSFQSRNQNQNQNQNHPLSSSKRESSNLHPQPTRGQSSVKSNNDRRVRFEESAFSSKPKREDLFSIQDENSDDEEVGKEEVREGKSADETVDAWREAESSSSSSSLPQGGDPLNASQR